MKLFAHLALGFVALASISAQTQTYRLQDLGVPAGRQLAHPAALNIQGWVAGSSELQAFRYVNGVMQELGTLDGGTVSSAAAINSSGEVVGASTFQNGGNIRHATLFAQSGNFDLGTLPLSGNYSFAAGINDNQEVVGSSGPSLSTSNTRAFIWDSGNGMRDLGTLGGQYAHASSINNNGVVTGSAQIPTGFGNFHAFIWDQANGMRDIGTIAGDSSSGIFISANNHIVGGSTINNFDNRSHAFLYDGAMHDLGSLGTNAFESDRSSASGVNIYDQVVGTSYRPYEGGALYQVAFVFREGQMFDLEKLVDASGADYRLYSAVAINDYGQIVVDAIKISTNQIRSVLLTPNPSGHDFAIVADSTTSASYNNFGAYPSINDSGTVTFYSELNFSGAGSTYKAERNAAPILISAEGTGAPSINNLGEVASVRSSGRAQSELYKSTDGKSVSQIAVTGTQFRSFPGYVSLADNTGMAVFYAPLNPVSPTRRGIFTGKGDGTTSLVVDNAGAFNDFGANPTVNNAGTVAFAGSLDTPIGGIYIGSSGATSPVVTNQTAALYNFDGAPFINNNGEISFLANEQATFAPAVFVVNQDGTNLRRIANVSGPFSQLRSPVVNDNGTIAFFAFLDNGGRGIFTGPNAGVDKVIAEGDPLFGSTVQSLGFFRGLNNLDEIAFFYTLADGRNGIARARVVPTADRLAISPRVESVQKVSGKMRISFATLSGQHYRVQRKTQLPGGFWDTVSGAAYITGTGAVLTLEDPESAGLTSAYYRVVLLP